MPSTQPVLRLGIAGLGSAGRTLLPAIDANPNVQLVAVADNQPEARETVAREYGAAAFDDIGALAAVRDLDAIYIATPTDLHAEHTAIAAAAGKHVLVEKPMAIGLDEAQAMIDATDRAGVRLMVGHSHSYDLPYQKMREIVAGGSLGAVRMLNNMYFTDWMYRPRRADEFDVTHGGGITFRQGAHQFDVLRLIGGGMVEAVRAETLNWDPLRPGIGAHTVLLRFAGGAVATAVYNGYGNFLSSELCFGAGELGDPQPLETAGAARRAHRARPAGDELAAKRTRSQTRGSAKRAPNQPFFGLTIVSCEGGDIRQSATGLFVYTERGREEIPLSLAFGTRDLVLAEFYGVVTGRREAVHDGRWGRANLEVCVAAIESSQTKADVHLRHQVPTRDFVFDPATVY